MSAAITASYSRLGNGPAVLRWPLLSTLAVGICIIAALWAILLHQAGAERHDAVRSAADEQATLASEIADQLRETISLADQLAQLVRKEISANGARETNFYSGIAVVDADGFLQSSGSLGGALQMGTTPYFSRQKDNHKDVAVVGFADPEHPGRLPQLYVSRRLTGTDGAFVGVVAVLLDSDYFNHELERAPGQASDVLLLLRSDGLVVGSRSSTIVPSPETLLRRHADTMGLINHAERRWTVQAVDSFGFVAVGRSHTELQRDVSRSEDKYYLAGGVLSVLVALTTVGTGFLATRTHHALVRLRDSERRANAANSLKSSFVAKISHDLRTPLNGIIGFADLLREAGSTEAERQYAGHIYDSATHLHSLVDQILDITKIEAGAAQLHRSEVELVPLLRSLTDLHAVAAQRKGVALRLDIGRDTPFCLYCDEVRLRQILSNVLHNAVKFTDVGEIVLHVDKTGDGVVFEVSDTGPGIPSGAMSELFSIFHQADAGVFRRHGGNGLGLAITKELVELHGGHISVDSRLGAGTTFRIVLP